MKHLKCIAIALVLLSGQMAFAQDFEIPNNLKLEKEADYIHLEADVLKGISWLENTGVNEQKTKRENTSAFVLRWMMGTPTMTIALQVFQTELTKKNPDLMISFLGGWTKFTIKNPSEKDDVIKANMAGFQSLIKVYTANKENGMRKDKKIEKLLKLDSTELETWIRKEVK